MKRLLVVLLAMLVAGTACYAQDDEELLPPEQAFAMEAAVVDGKTVRLTWSVADHYYLYRDKFRVRSTSDGVALGEPVMPAGKIKHDEFFGDVEVYRGTVVVDVPVTRDGDAGAARQLVVEATSQGCADLGVCYPPFVQTVQLELPAAPALVANDTGNSSLGALQAIANLGNTLGLSGPEDELLHPDEAFQVSVEIAGDRTLIANWQIADGYYLYKDKFGLDLRNEEGIAPAGVRLGPLQMPRGKEKQDEYFGRMEVYYQQAALRAQVLANGMPAGQPITLQAKYQGCAELGVCYPPITRYLSFTLPPATAVPASLSAATPAPPAPALTLSEQDRLAQLLANGAAWVTIASFFGFGLLLAFTPCVFPMIPILSSIIVGQGHRLTTRRAFLLSLVYVLAMAFTYTVAGMLAGLFGGNLQAAFQDPWIIGTFAALFAVLSLSMFGFYELQIPSALQNRLSAMSNRQEGGSYLGVAVMGLLSALIVGPCVAPPLAGALIYIGNTGDPWLGGLALFALSMGMGAPLLLIGTSAGKFLPRSGAWMNTVKAVFGVLLLAVAVWMLERILPGEITMILWALLLIVPAIYLGALEPVKVEATGWTKLWKGLGLVMLIYGGVLIVGAASGSRDVFQPLRLLAGSGGGASAVAANGHALPFRRIKSVSDLDREVAAASSRGQPVMLDFYADWCVSCKEMERFTFSDTDVQLALANTTLLQADVTANDQADKALLAQFGLYGPPSILFYGSDGVERRPYRLVGYLGPQEFRSHVQQAIQ